MQKKHFNLLHKLDVQLDWLDKLHKFILPLRIVMLVFMLSIIGVFIFRFILDKQLNDLIKESKKQKEIIEIELKPYEKNIFETEKNINILKAYVNSNDNTKPFFFYPSYFVLENLIKLQNEHSNIIIKNYDFSESNGNTNLTISGESNTFVEIDSFIVSIRKLNFVKDAIIVSQSSTTGENPKFTINVILNDKIYAK